jgi:glucosyl-3-phosphoglycerate synthase
VRDATERWLPRRTWTRPTWTAAELTAARAGRTVSVVLPALDEEETVGGVVAAVRPLLGTLVDEIVVVDSGSTDATAARARAAGARVVPRDEVLPEVPVRAGKARCCGARSRPRRATWWCSSTPTSSTSAPTSS